MEKMTIIYSFPSYVEDIMNVIGDGDWLVHNFDVEEHLEMLNPAAYVYNANIENISYTACIDLNIFQFIVNAVKKDSPNDLYRKAIAYLAFFQIAGIKLDPTYAIYEKVNHKPLRVREGVEDLVLFRRLDNTPTIQLAEYAAKKTDSLIIENSANSTDVGHIEIELTKHSHLKEWLSLYTIVLGIVNIEFDNTIPKKQKLGAFVDWSFRYFRHSLPGFVFAVSVMGHEKFGKVMKYEPSKPVDERCKALENMTWDLYYMQQYFRRWTDKVNNDEILFLTSDKTFARILSLSIEIQKTESLKPLMKYISGFDQQYFTYVMHPETYPHDRIYKSNIWSVEYRNKLITELEEKLIDYRN